MSPARPRTLIHWLLLAVVALIVYGSLYPFNFRADAVQGGLLQAVRELSWARAGRGDRISNVLLYLPLGFCLFLWLENRWRQRLAILVTTALGSLLSLCIEVAQAYISTRVPSLTDLSLNATGTLGGGILGIAWRTLVGWMHLPARAEKPNRDRGAALLIGLWLAWRLAPFVPMLDLAKLKAALHPLFNPHFEIGVVLVHLTFWTVVSQALDTLVSRTRSVETLLLLIASVLVGRLIVADQAFIPSELLALVLLLPVLVVMHKLIPGPKHTVLIVSMAAAFVFVRLAPFNFTATASSFDFWPFLHLFTSDFPRTLLTVDWIGCWASLFLFGALFWVIQRSGTSFNFAAGVVLAGVLVTEIMRLWLPDRAASITDPVLAVVVLYAFRYTLQAKRRGLRNNPISRHARSL
ncbi:MAG TPA: VanZ family protein [Steroidobacteraceae bacterium]|jgi:VanZ family protein